MNKYANDDFSSVPTPAHQQVQPDLGNRETAHEMAARDDTLSGIWDQLFDDGDP